jgi:hypothetical protein
MKDQKVTRSSIDGQYESPETADPKTTYETVEEHESQWKKEYERLGKCLEEADCDEVRYVMLHAIYAHCCLKLRR